MVLETLKHIKEELALSSEGLFHNGREMVLGIIKIAEINIVLIPNLII